MTDSTLPAADLTELLVERVRAATATGTALRIVGGDTKRFYGRQVAGEPLAVAGHTGVLSYDPAELVLTARGGTRLAEVETLLREHGQHLPFEPPSFGPTATLGGTIAAALAGPGRVARGPVRDYVLGARLLTGDGRVLRFGGEVMKNVAGYDVSRLLAGSLGVLGVILDVSLKVLPAPVATRTVRLDLEAARALEWLADPVHRGLPLTASFHADGRLWLRFDGASDAGLDGVCATVGGETLLHDAGERLWHDVREQRHPWFLETQRRLWRLHVPANAATQSFDRAGACACEWHGTQRWLADVEREVATGIALEVGGQATLFRGGDGSEEVFVPPAPPMLELQRRVKHVFDPAGILNTGRLYATL